MAYKILILNTGGTFCMVPGKNGFVPQTGQLEKALKTLCPKDIAYDIHNFDPLIDSADMSYRIWNRLMEIIFQKRDEYDGFVVTHGTDSMSYTAASLFFGLYHFKKPIILTGAMQPLGEENSDAPDNLYGAITTACRDKIGTFLWFAGQCLSGDRLVKATTFHRNAFRETEKSPSENTLLPSGVFKTPRYFKPCRIAVITAMPDINPTMVNAMLEQSDGAILRCFGSGTFPSHLELGRVLKQKTARGFPIIAVSQSESHLNLSRYAASSHLLKAGVISGGSLTTEAAVVRLSLALSGHQDMGFG